MSPRSKVSIKNTSQTSDPLILSRGPNAAKLLALRWKSKHHRPPLTKISAVRKRAHYLSNKQKMQGKIHILAKLVVVTFTLPGICLHPHPSFMVDFPASHVSFLGDMYLWCQTKKLSISPEKKKNCGKLLGGPRSAKNHIPTQRPLRFPPRTTKAWNKRLGPTPVRVFVLWGWDLTDLSHLLPQKIVRFLGSFWCCPTTSEWFFAS